MLAYYRNPVNFHFFNEALIVCSLYSFGIEQAWKGGVDVRDLRERTMFLANLLKREEVLKDNIVDVFEQLLQFMCNQKVISIEENIVTFKGEAASLLIGSFVWPYIDTYYSSFVYALSMVKNRDIPEAALVKDVQWLAETLYVQNKI
jgi:glycerol-3-phosphate O-acyltransferase